MMGTKSTATCRSRESKMADAPDELVALAEQARRQRLAGDHHDGRDSEFPLVGYCFDNAFVLYCLLTADGYDPCIVEGTTDRVADDLVQSGVTLADLDTTTDLAGLVHYWVEVDVDGTTWHLDIASDTWDHLGECLVTNDLPDAYTTLPDSYSEGETVVENVVSRGDRCRACGDHAYTEGGCPECCDQQVTQ